jgi:hypothetical protein
MGLATLARLATELIQGGLPATTPAVAVERGTTPEQRTVHATLENLADQVEAAGLQSPTLLLIGKVVALSPGWKECQREGKSLHSPGPHRLPLPELPELQQMERGASSDSEFAGWRMLE